MFRYIVSLCCCPAFSLNKTSEQFTQFNEAVVHLDEIDRRTKEGWEARRCVVEPKQPSIFYNVRKPIFHVLLFLAENVAPLEIRLLYLPRCDSRRRSRGPFSTQDKNTNNTTSPPPHRFTGPTPSEARPAWRKTRGADSIPQQYSSTLYL